MLTNSSLPDLTKPPPNILSLTDKPNSQINCDNVDQGMDSTTPINLNNINKTDSFDGNIADFVEEIRTEIKGVKGIMLDQFL